MKKVIFLIFTFSIVVNGQTKKDSINYYETLKKTLESKVLTLKDSIQKIELKIRIIKSVEIQKSVSDSSLIGITEKGAKLKKKPEIHGDILIEFSEPKKVIILDYHDDFFGVCVDSICGYMNKMWIEKNKQIDAFVKMKIEQEIQLIQIDKERKIKAEAREYAELEKKHLKKYGEKVYQKLKKGYYWIGMNQEMATIALGSPDDINRSVGSWGVHEQWVYKNLYLYFENGKLKSYQD
jgi:hypothetical protein